LGLSWWCEILKPKPHQLEAAELINSRHYQVLADDMGLGKTFTSILSFLDTMDLGYCVVVCPSYLKLNWVEEFRKCAPKVKVKVLNTKKCIKKFDKLKDDVAIISYSMLHKFPTLFRYATCIIADEAHYLCNMEAQRTAAFHYYISKFKPLKTMLLTGTPINNRVKEFYSLLKITEYGGYTDGAILKRFKTDECFAEYFSIPTTIQFYRNRRLISNTTYSGFRNLKELKALMETRVIRRENVEGLNLPSIQFKRIKAFKYKENSRLELGFNEYKEQVDKSITTAKVSSAVRKAPITASYVKDLLDKGHSPLLVYSDHREPLRIMMEKLSKYRIDTIHGEVGMDKRNVIKTKFQNNELDILFCTIGAANAGLTLTASNHIIFNDYSWTPSKNRQVIKRINRIGATKTSFIHSMLGDHLDERLLESLEEKENTIKNVLTK